jgi:hypothetical protein
LRILGKPHSHSCKLSSCLASFLAAALFDHGVRRR